MCSAQLYDRQEIDGIRDERGVLHDVPCLQHQAVTFRTARGALGDLDIRQRMMPT